MAIPEAAVEDGLLYSALEGCFQDDACLTWALIAGVGALCAVLKCLGPKRGPHTQLHTDSDRFLAGAWIDSLDSSKLWVCTLWRVQGPASSGQMETKSCVSLSSQTQNYPADLQKSVSVRMRVSAR